MRLPEIHGVNKIRDAGICKDYALNSMTANDIGIKYQLSEVRILQILRTNKSIINIDREWERTKAVLRAQKEIKNAPLTKKDKLDWEAHLQKLLDGGQPLVDNSQHTHIKYEWNNNPDQVQPTDLSERDTSRLP